MKAGSSKLAHKPTYVTHGDRRFLIMDAPTDSNLETYVAECKKHNVHTVARACEPTYATGPLTRAGIRVFETPFPDGDPPPHHVIDQWLGLVEEEFAAPDKRTLAVHCVAGLGRAPVLVAVALVEDGMDAMDAIDLIRRKRRGAINARQLKFLESYVPRRKKGGCCTLM